jgi:hypothetical protein
VQVHDVGARVAYASGEAGADGRRREVEERPDPRHPHRVQNLFGGAPRVARDHHLVEIRLTSEYPRVAPQCKILTPIFHPNIDPTTICVGDHWAAGERLVDLTIRIGEMIAYQAYNIQSPLDAEAAMWADLNATGLPVDSRSLRDGMTPVEGYAVREGLFALPRRTKPLTDLHGNPVLPAPRPEPAADAPDSDTGEDAEQADDTTTPEPPASPADPTEE